MNDSSGITLVERAAAFPSRTALIASDGCFSYAQVLEISAQVAACLLGSAKDLQEQRVAFLVRPGSHYVAVQWGIWRAGAVAVPLSPSQAPPEWDHVIADSGATLVVTAPEFAPRLGPLATTHGARLVLTTDLSGAARTEWPRVTTDRRAMILYTSGTTSKPKGVVTTHRNIEAQITSLTSAWDWTADDRILLVLPLHHVHGIINVLGCALWSGATCEMLPRFDAQRVWQRFSDGDLTLFMAVPTIYAKLAAAWEAMPSEQQRAGSAGCARMRVMVSGSAAMPARVFEQWRRISGHVLLERYGMTEIGMALSNPLHGERRQGHVGGPLPGVEVRLVDETGQLVAPGVAGEIEIQGPAVFLEYWGKPEATAVAFREGWFRTGDIAVVDRGMYRLLGRNSVDIIKSGGYKISALEIEEALREHPDVRECAVVGVEDLEWGERVGAALVVAPDRSVTLESLRDWAGARLAKYKLPTRLLVLDELPRNPMGKVVKPALARLFHRP